MNSTLKMAEGALSPVRAWEWCEPMRLFGETGRSPMSLVGFQDVTLKLNLLSGAEGVV